MLELLANIFISIGLLLCLAGTLCIFFAKNFKQRLLLGSIIDSCGLLTFVIGIMIRFGFSIVTLKVFFVLCIALAINPITANKIAYSAFYNKPLTDKVENDDTV